MTLKEFFTEHPKAAVALSGGVDSSYLFYSACVSGADVRAYFVDSAFQPTREKQDAERIAADIGVPDRLTILHADVLAYDEITANPENRCYYCKKQVFGLIAARARHDGYSVILDGTNASDDQSDRPGMKALQELNVYSPLLICGLTKEDIRARSHDAGLFTWNKPSYACLATRIPHGEEINDEKLRRICSAEGELRAMGFSDLRVRKRGETGLIQLPAEQFAKAVSEHAVISKKLSKYFETLALDLRPRKSN